jgi:two-component system, response regulator
MNNQPNIMNIVVADDDMDDQMLMKKAFQKGTKNVNFIFVENGIELMNYLEREGKYNDDKKYPEPDLILLDLNMPKKDGREVLAELKKSREFCKIPVVVFTTSESYDDLIFSYTKGGNSYIVKPTSFDDLIKVGTELENYWHKTVSLPR